MRDDVMMAYESFASPQTADVASLPARIGEPRSCWARVRNWLSMCADYYEAAALYDQFIALSDAELARRGLSRATLARDVREARDRVSDPGSR